MQAYQVDISVVTEVAEVNVMVSSPFKINLLTPPVINERFTEIPET